MTSRLIDSLATTDALAEVFSDRAIVRGMLEFEAALAEAESRAGVIPPAAVPAIARAAAEDGYDATAMAQDARRSGTPAIALVKALTAKVAAHDEVAARFVHWGATSQDVADTALAGALARAHTILSRDQGALDRALRALSDTHATTVMLGRTLLQPAPPITFGLKVAGYVAALGRAWERLDHAFTSARVLQFGGASGTLAALGDKGPTVARELASILGLADPAAPWHAERDRLGSVVTAAGVYTAVLAKIARDISLLMQEEVGEAAEAGGGSSTMPQKRNPAGCAIVLAASVRMPGLVASFLTGMVQEHERGVGGWHAEWPIVADVVETAGSALAAMVEVISALTVRPDRMLANIAADRGLVFAERLSMALIAKVGRERAHALVRDAVEETRRTGRSFSDVVAHDSAIAAHIAPSEIGDLDRPDGYLGAADVWRTRLLAGTSD